MTSFALFALSLFIRTSLASPLPEPDVLPFCGSSVADEAFPMPFIGQDPKILNLKTQIAMVAPTDSSVLILGESGTGKEVVAQAIKALSNRKDKPFVTFNVAALPVAIAESELFGHAKGSFTGATGNKRGLFKRADGGTLFLDEIGEMDLGLQAKVLRVLEYGQIDVVGGETEKTSFRLIAATNASLEEMVREKKFRLDLFFRIQVVELRIPPLRERRGDIPLLVNHFCGVEAKKRGSVNPPKTMSLSAMGVLLNHNWPGNIRELQNVIEAATIFAGDSHEIQEKHLPQRLRFQDPLAEAFAAVPPLSLDEVQKIHVTQVLKGTQGNKSEACRILGIHRGTLDRNLERWGLK